jgi:hypothetical protein
MAMTGPGMLLFYTFPAVLGVILAGVGLIVRLCESSWKKKAGSMGSTGLFLISALWCLPVILYLAWKFLIERDLRNRLGRVHSPTYGNNAM